MFEGPFPVVVSIMSSVKFNFVLHCHYVHAIVLIGYQGDPMVKKAKFTEDPILTRYNELLYKNVPGIASHILHPTNNKMYEKELRYNEPPL